MSYQLSGDAKVAASLIEVAAFLGLPQVSYSEEVAHIDNPFLFFDPEPQHNIKLDVVEEGGSQSLTGYQAIYRFFLSAGQNLARMQQLSDFDKAKADDLVRFAQIRLPLDGLDSEEYEETYLTPSLQSLNELLQGQSFLLGEQLSVADVVMAHAVQNRASLVSKKGLGNIAGWYNAIIATEGLFEGFSEIDSSSSAENDVIALLNSLSISSSTRSHSAVHTMEELVDALQWNEPEDSNKVLAKNIFLKEKKTKEFYLISMSHLRTDSLKSIGSKLGLSKKQQLRMADEDALMAEMGVQTGHLSPLCLSHRASPSFTPSAPLHVVLDAGFFSAAQAEGLQAGEDIETVLARQGEGVDEDEKVLHFHPMDNSLTTALSSTDLLRFLQHMEVVPQVLTLGDEEDGSGESKRGGREESKQGESKKQDESAQASELKARMREGTLLRVTTKRSEDLMEWYRQTIILSDLIDYSDVSGCYILKPDSYFVWEQLQNFIDGEIKKLGVRNVYFPLFIPKSHLQREKDHLEGFEPEVAWVTHAGSKELDEHLAIRPTSETVMYASFRNWIHSHRDLPLNTNQWCSVVRWEFKYPTPFLRSREFLWQEGHTVHATEEEAMQMVRDTLDIYRRAYEELLAVPTLCGRKSEKEKFAGGDQTLTTEVLVRGSGRAVQGATSHLLGQNFAKMFNISYLDEHNSPQIPYQTSWGFTTRSIGVGIMSHGDDQGLVWPPRVAPTQVVIVPVPRAGKTPLETLTPLCAAVESALREAGVRVHLDQREHVTSGWKYNHWEQKGVPIRIEVGGAELESGTLALRLRWDGSRLSEQFSAENGEEFAHRIHVLLEEIQENMYQRARGETDESVEQIFRWEDFVPCIDRGHLALTPFCNEGEWEEEVKRRSKEEALRGLEEDVRTSVSAAAKSLCMPLEQPPLEEGAVCFISGKPATTWMLWGRSY
jgi:prolyl-tRNA synthetase